MKQRLLILTLVVTALVAAVPAFAQISQPRTRPERPTRGLFGGGTGNTSQQLVLNASFGGGYDDDLLAEATGAGPGQPSPHAPRSGQFGLGTANLSYSVNAGRVTGGMSAGTSTRYYPGMTEPVLGGYSVSGQVTASLSAKTMLSTSVQVGRQPYNLLAFYGDDFGAETAPATPVDPGSATLSRTYQSLQSAVQLSQQLTRRLSLRAGYGYSLTDPGSASVDDRYVGRTGNAGVSFSLAKGLGLRLGYAVSDAQYGAPVSATPFKGHTIDGGIDFNRALSLTRRSRLSFATGMVGLSDQSLKIRYYFTGNVNFVHEIGRSWSVTAGFNRSANFHQTFGQPVLSDQVGAALGGQIGRRLQVNTQVGYVRGAVGIAAGAPGYAAASAGTGLRLAITRKLGLGVNYRYYRYLFDDGVALPNGLAPEMDRQGVSVSLDLWAPLIMRSRRPNAAR